MEKIFAPKDCAMDTLSSEEPESITIISETGSDCSRKGGKTKRPLSEKRI